MNLPSAPTLDTFPVEDVSEMKMKLTKTGSASVDISTHSGDHSAFISGSEGAISFLKRLLAYMEDRNVQHAPH